VLPTLTTRYAMWPLYVSSVCNHSSNAVIPCNTTTHARTAHRRAKVFCKMGRFKDAIGDLSVALSSQSKDLNLLFSRAICFKEDGQLAAAVADFDLILSMDRSSTQAFYHRGKRLLCCVTCSIVSNRITSL
jgi:tetratricopeptide (TPR) repeat protein